VLIDFGLSRHEELPDLLVEQYRSATGSPEYMAPEQLFNVRSDKRSDIYAIGCILYQMLTGRSPFGAPSRIKDVRKRLWRDPVPPRAVRPETPPWLQEIVLRCLEPNPAHRYKSAGDLQFDLSHPELVEKAARADKTAADGILTVMTRRWQAERTRMAIMKAAAAPPRKPPIVVVALDLRPEYEELRHAMLEAAVAALANLPGARIACVNVLVTGLIATDENVDAEGHNIHVKRLAELRRWVEPLGLPRGQATFHLLEAKNVAPAILEFARANKAAHLVIGVPKDARIGPGSVADRLRIDARCPVSIVRSG
jgi:nucleotide-binding universal stress UspA family protein